MLFILAPTGAPVPAPAEGPPGGCVPCGSPMTLARIFARKDDATARKPESSARILIIPALG